MATGSPQRFAGRVVLITGASGGFGLAMARAFLREGARVTISARNPDRLQAAADQLQKDPGGDILAVPADVANRPQVETLIARAIEHFGFIDILINNAGSGLIAPIELIQVEDAQTLFQTNFFGAFNCVQAALPHLRRRGRGHIINMSSAAGLRGIPNSSIYCASKAALLAFTDSLRIEVAPQGIHVTAVCPSRTNDTQFVEHARKYGPVELYHVPESLTTDMVVAAVLNAAARPKSLVILPFHAKLLHFTNKFAPRLVDRYLAKHRPQLTPSGAP